MMRSRPLDDSPAGRLIESPFPSSAIIEWHGSAPGEGDCRLLLRQDPSRRPIMIVAGNGAKLRGFLRECAATGECRSARRNVAAARRSLAEVRSQAEPGNEANEARKPPTPGYVRDASGDPVPRPALRW
jgi:hypothetical protein